MGADPGSVRPDRSGGGHPPGSLAADEPAAFEVAMTKLQWPDKKRGGPQPPQLDASSDVPSSDGLTVQCNDQILRSYKYLGERVLILGPHGLGGSPMTDDRPAMRDEPHHLVDLVARKPKKPDSFFD